MPRGCTLGQPIKVLFVCFYRFCFFYIFSSVFQEFLGFQWFFLVSLPFKFDFFFQILEFFNFKKISYEFSSN
jgi:hypothetical protein